MTRHPPHLPLVLALTLFAAGIMAGGEVGAFAFMQGGAMRRLTDPRVMWLLPTLPALAAMMPAMRKRHGKAATAALLVALFAAGMFVMMAGDGKSDGQGGSMAPQAVERFMADRRATLAEAYGKAGLTGDGRAIVTAMTIGERQQIDRQQREDYRTSGAAHVLALSGLHIAIIFLILRLLIPLRGRPRTAAAIHTAMLWAYVLLVGSPPSVVRAATMLTFYTLLDAVGRKRDGLMALLATAFLILAVRPGWLYDWGFQMSFAAVLGITTFYGPLYKMLDFSPYVSPIPWFMQQRSRTLRYRARAVEMFHNAILRAGSWIWGMTVLSLTAQVAVAPIVAHHFQQFAPMFLLSNYIVSPLAPPIIVLSLTVLVLYGLTTLLPILSPLLHHCVWLLQTIVDLQNDAITQIAALGT